MRLARPQIARGDAEHRDAVFQFSAFASLYAIAEPPLRTGDAAMNTPRDVIAALLDAFKMSKGIRAVQDPFIDELKESGAFDPDLWKDNRDDIIPTLETDYPQLGALNEAITENCSLKQQQPCLTATRALFVCIGVFAVNHKNHSSLRLIQTWPMDIDVICLQMFEANDFVGLVILAHYAAMMSMRSNYWFYKRWPPLLLESIKILLPTDWHRHLEWPSGLVVEHSKCSDTP